MPRAPRIKSLIRVAAAMFAALFGALALSVQICTYAMHRTAWPHWADLVCGHNVGVQWLLSAPAIFVLTSLLLGKTLRRFRPYVAVLLLAIFGIYGLVNLLGTPNWWKTGFPAAALVAAVAVATGQRWARFLVYALSLLFAGDWLYFVWRAAVSGAFRDTGAEMTALSLLPGAAVVLLAAYSCYVVTSQPLSETAWRRT